MEWRRVQVWVPRVSTSGGQSVGRAVVCGGVGVLVVRGEEEEEGWVPVDFFIIASQSAEDVHVRQLELC